MKQRTREFRETVLLAIEQAEVAHVLAYQDVEALLHMALDKGTKRLPWWRSHHRTIFHLEDDVENVLLSVAGLALSYVRDRGATEHRDVVGCFLDAMNEWTDTYRRQFDPGGELPSGERYYLPAHPTVFSAIEASGADEPADYLVESVLMEWGADLAEPEPAELDTDESFEDPRLQAMWDVANANERELLRHMAAGVPMSQASLLCGKAEGWGSSRVSRLRELASA